MQTLNKFKGKNYLSACLIMLFGISFFPTVVLAYEESIDVSILIKDKNEDTQRLDGENRYLVKGKVSDKGSLGVDGCTAEFDAKSGTLYLYNYEDGSISIYEENKNPVDLTINLKGNNLVENKASFENKGIYNMTGGDINIISEDKNNVLEVILTNNNINGDSYGVGTNSLSENYLGSINIMGEANIKIKIEDNTFNGKGVFAKDDLVIKDNASLSIEAKGADVSPLQANANIIMNTNGNIDIESSGVKKPIESISGKVHLQKASIFNLKTKEDGSKIEIIYNQNDFNIKGPIKTDGGYEEVSYRYIDEGWNKLDEKWYYMDQNKVEQKGWLKDKNKWYFLQDDGSMKTGWLKDKDSWYYLEANGAMKTGWLKDKNKWYFLEDNGIMKTGWLKDKENWYYLEKNGVMKTSWINLNNKWYFLENNGIMKTDWLKYKEKWYFLQDNGVMKIGWEKIKGKWYKFDGNGVMEPEKINKSMKVIKDIILVNKTYGLPSTYNPGEDPTAVRYLNKMISAAQKETEIGRASCRERV